MHIPQTIFAPLFLKKLTVSQVHKAIQGMDGILPKYNNAISIHAIAEQLHVNDEELCAHINTLKNLYYIRFTDRTNETIFLTLNGRFTVVPQV